MSSPAKLEAARVAGYRVRPSCSTCSAFTPTDSLWGLCAAIKYTHEKHGSERKLGVRRDGWCPSWGLSPGALPLDQGGYESEATTS